MGDDDEDREGPQYQRGDRIHVALRQLPYDRMRVVRGTVQRQDNTGIWILRDDGHDDLVLRHAAVAVHAVF